ncbi:MAG: hypothetical protein WCF17_00400 [Terracidiphilus sp.]
MHSTDSQENLTESAPVPKHAGRFGPMFRHIVPIAILFMFPAIFTSSLNWERRFVADPDIWWHLADARQIFTSHQFLRTETTSFTVAGKPWVDPEWLSEIPYWAGYRALGLRGVYLTTWLVLSANLLLFYWRGLWRTGHAGAALLASSLGLVLLTVNSGPRTIAIAYLAMASELMILERAEAGKKGLLWLLPLLFCVWANLHGSWLIGIGLLVLYIVCGWFGIEKGIFDQPALAPGDRKRLLAVLGASLVAVFANPYSWRLVWNPFDMMLNQKLNIANVVEWKPLALSTPAGATAFAALCFLVVANGLKSRKWRVYELALLFFGWFAAFDHMRFVFMAAVLTVPIFAEEIRRAFDLEPVTQTSLVKNAIFLAAAACVVAFIFPSQSALEKRVAHFFPVDSVAAVEPSWRTFNYAEVGGMMAFQSRSSFIDSRFDIFEHNGVMLDYLKVTYLRDSLKILDQYRIDHVLVLDTMPLSYLLQHQPGWRVIRTEKIAGGACVTFARTGNSEVPAGASGIASLEPR